MKNANKRGFTLIELLIVLFIIAIIAGSVSLNARGFNQSIDTVGDKFMSLLRLVQQNAVIRDTYYAMSVDKKGYHLWQYDLESRKFVPFTNQKRLKALPEEYELSLKVNHPKQFVIFNPAGQITPFTLDIQNTKTNYAIMIEGKQGKLQLLR